MGGSLRVLYLRAVVVLYMIDVYYSDFCAIAIVISIMRPEKNILETTECQVVYILNI